MKGCQPLSIEQIWDVMESFSGRMAARNRALFAVGIDTGARISELLSLNVASVVTPRGTICEAVEFTRRHVKRKIEGRRKALHPWAREHLLEWLHHLRGMDGVFAWTPLFATKAIPPRRLSRREAYSIIRRAMIAAGVNAPRYGTHVMRKTYAAGIWEELLSLRAAGEAIEPLLEAQIALGHHDVSSTAKYLRFGGAYEKAEESFSAKISQNRKTQG